LRGKEEEYTPQQRVLHLAFLSIPEQHRAYMTSIWRSGEAPLPTHSQPFSESCPS
jgi:hypothetical protein